MPSAFAITRHHATMVVTAQARGLFTAPAMSRRAHHPVSADKFLFLTLPLSSPLNSSIIHPFVSSPSGKTYRQEQCELRNGPQTDPKGVKTFVEWVPKYAGVLPKDVCKLTCRAKGTGYYVVFSQRVRSKKVLLCQKLSGWHCDANHRLYTAGGGRNRVSALQQLSVREGKMHTHGLRRHHRLQTAV